MEILFQNGFWITYAAIKCFLFGMWVPSNVSFLECGSHQISFFGNLMAYIINNFLKRQFCFPREKKILSFLTCLHNPSKFPFWEFPKKAILFLQSKEKFIIFDMLT